MGTVTKLAETRRREKRLLLIDTLLVGLHQATGALLDAKERTDNSRDDEYIDLMTAAGTAAVAANCVQANALMLVGACRDFLKEDHDATRTDDAQ
jgi:hypothetical protein